MSDRQPMCSSGPEACEDRTGRATTDTEVRQERLEPAAQAPREGKDERPEARGCKEQGGKEAEEAADTADAFTGNRG